MRKYRFIPVVVTYGSMLSMAILFITYYIERNIDTSRVNTVESAWIYFNNSIRLAAVLGTLGYTGLIIELNLLISLMQESTRKISQATRNELVGIQSRRDTRRSGESSNAS